MIVGDGDGDDEDDGGLVRARAMGARPQANTRRLEQTALRIANLEEIGWKNSPNLSTPRLHVLKEFSNQPQIALILLFLEEFRQPEPTGRLT